MFKSNNMRAALIGGCLLLLAAITAGKTPSFVRENVQQLTTDAVISEPATSEKLLVPDSMSATSVYYSVRRDYRRCASPFCGGYWVKRVNASNTRCANGQWSRECYVAEISWQSEPEIDSNRALLRGDIVARRPQGGGRRRDLGDFQVTESWQASSERPPTGAFYRVTDRNVRCITTPCPTHHAAKLNTTTSWNIAGVDFSPSGPNDALVGEASTAMTTSDGVLVSGSFKPVRGPGGKMNSLVAYQFYLRAKPKATGNKGTGSSKRCVRSGCSSQICADEEMMSTCEWRPEYACYQRARCERQSDGKCGFTKTPELTACLARIKV